MNTSHRFHLPIVSISVLASLLSTPGRASVAIKEFPIPTADRNPQEIVAGPDGNLWFTEGVPDGGIGRITPSGEITEFPLAPSNDYPPLGPITAGSDGALWFRSKDSFIGRMTPDGQVTEPKFPNILPFELTLGPDGHIWITGCTSIAQFTADGVRQFSLPLPVSSEPIDFCTVDGEPVGIATGPDGNLWFAMDGFGTVSDADRGQIGRITLSGQITLFDAGGNNPSEIAAGPDGNLWFTDNRHSAIGRSTLSGGITMYPIPSGDYARYITAGPDGNLWFTENADRIGRITPNGRIDEIPLPAGSGPLGITVGPDHAIWFTEAGSNKIGRLDPAGTCLPGEQTLCLGIFRITAAWEGSGQSGAGKPVSITPNTGAFWFFDASNVEVFVKILDFCPNTGSFGIYVNGLTHLGVTVTVTDTQSGTSKNYVNPDGAPFSLIFDGSTFACP